MSFVSAVAGRLARTPVALRDALWRHPDRVGRLLFAATAVLLLGAALLVPPNSHGDGGEYHMMAESLLRHGTPDLRPGDVRSLAARELRQAAGINFGGVLSTYFEAPSGGWYSYHFWGYSLLTVPARGVLRLARADLKGAQVTNALLFLLAIHQALFSGAFRPRAAVALALLALVSPAVWFVLWTQPESSCFSLVLLALVWARAGRRHLPVLCVALAAMQNPPLVLLVAPLAVRGCLPPEGRRLELRAALRSALAAFPALLPWAFFLWRFGTPSVIARESTSLEHLSAARALELFFDLNLGLLPYAPFTVLLFLLSLPLSLTEGRRALVVWGRAVLLFAMALSCTVTGNWNHGTAGPSRYAIWMLPLVLAGVAEAYDALLARAAGLGRRLWAGLIALAVASQAVIVVSRGGLVQPPDYFVHSYAARLVLRYAPAWYNPTPSIFVVRTNGSFGLRGDEPAIYQDGGCRKAWVRPVHARLLAEVCGGLPASAGDFFKPRTDRREWRYVDY